MKNKIWVLSVGFVLLFPNLVHADETKEVEFFPADPETGLQIEVPDTNLQSKQQITERQALPEKFDFMDGGFETPIRDQGNTELCWAYSGTDVLRISMKKKFGVDYVVSPNYFNYFYATDAFTDKINPFAQNRPLNGSGNTEILLEQAALDNMGVTEEVLKTPQFKFLIKPMLSQDFLAIKNQQIPMYADKIAFLPGVSYSKGIEEERKKKVKDIKSMIYKYGASTFHYDTKYAHSSDYYNQKTDATHVPIEDIKQGLVPNHGGEWATSNHNIVIIGWDDNYSKENFIKQPQNNGAFKMKGSWGPYSHNKGYFYMSYEDVYLQSSFNAAVDTQKKEYDFNHKYVNGGQGDILNYGLHSKELFLGNVFQTRKSEEELKAISLYTSQNNIKYELYYLDRDIKHGEKIFNYKDMTKIGEGIKEFGGVETVKVPTQKIPPNQEYTIIVKYIYPDDVPYFQLRMQRIKESDKDETPHLEKGRSFISTDGMKDEMDWKDMSGGDATGKPANVWLNAYTTEKKIAIETIQLDPTNITISVGEETELKATILPGNATNTKINWKSSDDSIASVSNAGITKAKKAGKVTVTATTEDGKKTATSEITVRPSVVKVTGVSLNPSALELEEHTSEQITATVTPTNATNKKITWSSSDESVATVTAEGKVKAIKAGIATITATTEDGKKTAVTELTVKSVFISVTDVSLDKELFLEVDQQMEAKATIAPSNATNQTVEWGSVDTSVATVDKQGKITAKKVGIATIFVITEDNKRVAFMKVIVGEKGSRPESALSIPDYGMSLGKINQASEKKYHKFVASRTRNYQVLAVPAYSDWFCWLTVTDEAGEILHDNIGVQKNQLSLIEGMTYYIEIKSLLGQGEYRIMIL
ncbi:Ig-like domain-containing protein [Enterococcus sp. AZ177]|uniref:Ig-like domain-containing protein n=1 Tax=unclassified Enterococcus TaxID=2608891 RepID=UPI003D2FCE6B